MDEGNKVTLRSCNGEEFEVKEEVVMQSVMFKLMIKDGCVADVILVHNVDGKILSKVLEFYKKHTEVASDKKELKSWDAEYIKVGQATLFDLILAVNYLNIKGLTDLAAQTVGDMIKGKTPKEIREHFNITNYFTPEEEEEIRKQNAWDFK